MQRFILAFILSAIAGCSSQPATESGSNGSKAGQQEKWTPFNDPANLHHPERQKNFHVEKYLLRLKIYDTEPKTEGRVEIAIKMLEAGDSITLDAGDMKIVSAKSAGHALAFVQGIESVSIPLGAKARKDDEINLTIEFEGHPTRGLFWVRPDEGYPGKPAIVWSQGETDYNHYWFPCYDYPNDRALSEVFFTVPSKYDVISNGEMIEIKDEGNGWSTHHWRMDIDHASYLLSVIVGEFDRYVDNFTGENGDVPVLYFVPKGRWKKEEVLKTFAATPAMLKFYSENIGTSYPYPKYAQTTIADFIWGGMENISATTLHEWTVRPDRAFLDGDAEGLIAHEMAHQWFGDLLTCRSWAHIWLNEGFATYFEMLWQEHQHGIDTMMDELEGGAQGYFGEDTRYRRPVVCEVYTDSDDMFDLTTYPRGAWVLHMLRRLIGDAAWWKGIRLYVKRHARTNVDSRDFQKAMEEVSGQDLGWFFDQWLYRSGYPEFKIAQSWDEAHRTLKLSVEQTQKAVDHSFGPLHTGTPAVFKAPVDLEIETKEGKKKYQVWIDQRRQDFYFPIDSEPLLVEFDSSGSVLKKVEFKKSVPQLIYQLQHDDESVGRKWAAGQLGDLGKNAVQADVAAAVDALRKAALEDKWRGVQIAAAEALVQIKSERAREALMACVKVPEARVRRAVLAGLGEWASNESVQKVLAGAMENDESWTCQSAAATSYGRAGANAYDAIAKLYAARESNPYVSPALLQGLVETGETRVVNELVKATAYGKHPWLRRKAIESLGRMLKEKKDDAAFDALVKLLEDKAYHVRAATIGVLADLGDKRAIEPLRKRTKAEFDARMRRSAAEAIRRIEAHP